VTIIATTAKATTSQNKNINYTSNNNQIITMMSSFTLSPSSAMASINSRGSSSRSSYNGHWENYILFATALFSLVLALSHQTGEPNKNNNNNNNTPSLFLGTSYMPTVTAATAGATTAVSTRTTTSKRTMMAMTAGSRTLIELGSREDGDYDREDRYQIDSTYLDEDYEHGLLILRRADIADASVYENSSNNNGNISKSTRRIMGSISSHVVLCNQKAIQTVKIPIVTMVLAGNIASMMGLLPMGLAGFLPAMGITALGMRMKTNWTATTFLRRLLLSSKGVTTITRPVSLLFSKLKFNKVSKFVSKLYKNRSKYSLLSDYFWYVHGEKDSDSGSGSDSDSEASPSTKRAIA